MLNITIHYAEHLTKNDELEELSSKVSKQLVKQLKDQEQLLVAAETTLLITDNKAIQELNAKFRKKAQATNILSFPSGEPYIAGQNYYLGDLVISLEYIIKEAEQQDKSLAAHFAHLLIHGILHLFDFTHDEAEHAAEMESLEIAILKELSIKNPYQ